MMDLIGRQAVIETLLKGKIDEDESLVECPAECNAMIDCAIEDIKALPSAQTVRKKGKWLKSEESIIRPYMCSNCGSLYDVDTIMGELCWNYCPNCGAEMESDAP